MSGACSAGPISVQTIGASLIRDHFVVVPARDMQALLSVGDAPAAEALWALWTEGVPQRDQSGRAVYASKSTLVTYYELDAKATEEAFDVRRSSAHDWLNESSGGGGGRHVVEHIDPTTSHNVRAAAALSQCRTRHRSPTNSYRPAPRR
jgi:hypothetical protein